VLKRETLLSERRAKDAIFSDVQVQIYTIKNDRKKYFAKKASDADFRGLTIRIDL
jgi:hypothetical protein